MITQPEFVMVLLEKQQNILFLGTEFYLLDFVHSLFILGLFFLNSGWPILIFREENGELI